MWQIRAMRLTEGAIVHRIHRVTRIRRVTARARRIRSRLRPGFHASAAQRASGHHHGQKPRKREGPKWENTSQPHHLSIEAAIRLWPLTGNDRPYPHGSRYYHQHHPPPSRAD